MLGLVIKAAVLGDYKVELIRMKGLNYFYELRHTHHNKSVTVGHYFEPGVGLDAFNKLFNTVTEALAHQAARQNPA